MIPEEAETLVGRSILATYSVGDVTKLQLDDGRDVYVVDAAAKTSARSEDTESHRIEAENLYAQAAGHAADDHVGFRSVQAITAALDAAYAAGVASTRTP